MLLILVLCVAAYFPLNSAFEPWFHQRLVSRYPVFVTLSKFNKGDTVQRVQRKAPHLKHIARDSRKRVATEEFLNSLGAPFEPTDEFYEHRLNVRFGNVVLVFRDGRLVNDFNPIAESQSRGQPVPSMWFRMGIMPYYVIFVGLLATFITLVRYRRGRPKTELPSDE